MATQPTEPRPFIKVRLVRGDNWQGSVTDHASLVGLTTGAFFASNWGAPHNALLYNPSTIRTTDKQIAECRKGLLDSWGISDGADALSTISSLLEGMHAPLYATVNPLVQEALTAGGETLEERSVIRDRHHSFLRSFAEHPGAESQLISAYDNWTQAFHLGIGKSFRKDLYTGQPTVPDRIDAWDIQRAVFVARAAVTAGHIDEGTAWDFVRQAGTLAQTRYGNWRQFAEGTVVGYGFWYSGLELSGAVKSTLERRRWVLALLSRPTSPWLRVPLR